MKKVRGLLVTGAALLLYLPAALAQPPAPKPGPEHDFLKKMVGTWDATVKFSGGESKATATYKMDLGGLWLVTDFLGEFGGQKFQGKGLDGYDPIKKKYVSVWVDSMAASPMVSEGTLDKQGKVLTMIGEGPGMDGKPAKFKMVTEHKDEDTMIFSMSGVDKNGKEDQSMMTITYKRRK
jgi:hypothetical protein